MFVFSARPPINLDYLLLGALAPWLGASLAAVALAVLVLFDFVITIVAPTFNFSAGTLAQAAASLFDLDAVYLLTVAGPMFLALVASATIARVLIGGSTQRILTSAVMLFAGLAAAAADVGLSVNRFHTADSPLLKINVATSSGLLAVSGFREAKRGATRTPDAYGVASATDVVFERLATGAHLPPRIVVVVVESMGLFDDPATNDLQLTALRSPALTTRYDVRIASVPFKGSTVAGELRELCKVRMNSVSPNPEVLPVGDCLPAQLSKRGYKTIAAHGFQGSTFSRSIWYPGLGFDQSVFGPELFRATDVEETCGVNFVGVCDPNSAEWLLDQLIAAPTEKLFAYWLTLNGHLPARRPRYAEKSTVDCSLSSVTAGNEEMCFLVQYHDIVLGDVADIAMHPELPPAAFVVVGDHIPPFSSQTNREVFDETSVPFVTLWPKEQGVGEQSVVGQAQALSAD